MSNQDIGDLCKEWTNNPFFGAGCLEGKCLMEIPGSQRRFFKKKVPNFGWLIKVPYFQKECLVKNDFWMVKGLLGRVFFSSLSLLPSRFFYRLLIKKQTIIDNWCNRLPEPKQRGLLLTRQRCSSCESGSPSDSIEPWGNKQLQKMEDRRFTHRCVVKFLSTVYRSGLDLQMLIIFFIFLVWGKKARIGWKVPFFWLIWLDFDCLLM